MKNKFRGKNESIPELGQDVKHLARLEHPSAPTESRKQIALEYKAFQNGRWKRDLIKPVHMQTEVETDYYRNQ
jgi:hypothetical protein